MSLRCVLPVLFLILGAFAGPGALAAARTFQIENWTGVAYHNDHSKQFERCAASVKGPNGAAISYAINRNLRWTLAISNENWNLYSGLALNVSLKLDERTLQGRGAGIGKDGFEVQVEDDIALFSSLRTAFRMRATVGGSTLDFDLTNSDLALSTLAQCALRQTGLLQRPLKQNPSPKKSAAQPAPSYDKALTDEAAAAARALGEYARLAGFHLLGPTEPLYGARGAMAWKADSAAGAVFVSTSSVAGGFDQMANRMIEHGMRACRGEYFFVSATETVDAMKVVRVYDACKMPDATAITYHVAVPRGAGGYYVIASSAGVGFAIALQQQAEIIDAKIRSAMTLALRKAERNAAEAQPPPPREESPSSREQ